MIYHILNSVGNGLSASLFTFWSLVIIFGKEDAPEAVSFILINSILIGIIVTLITI